MSNFMGVPKPPSKNQRYVPKAPLDGGGRLAYTQMGNCQEDRHEINCDY